MKCVYEQVEEKAEDPNQIEEFLNGMKRQMFLSILRQTFSFHKHAWAKVTVSQLIKKVYLDK